ncbi:MAG: hypothetical protein Q8N14_02650, partial [Candidatus Omnitrophota bacterium]|nr:hypothetical protein [Candidatus Omnitrophota bacterium]
KKTKFGIGFQGLKPTNHDLDPDWGISGILDITPKVSFQGILGLLLGDVKMYAGRGIYKFKKGPYWNAYGYGMLSTWSYPRYKTLDWSLFGAGVGIEYDWRGLSADFSNLPPIWLNFEIGLGSGKFKETDYNFSTFVIGIGVHYRF